MLPKITLVTTTLNAEKFLARTLCSVAAQNYPNLEYIVIDAGSTDATATIVQAHAALVHRVETVPGIGLYAGLQHGFDLGTGEIMGWLNADDMLHMGALHTVGGLFAQRAEAHWVTGLSTLIDDQDRVFHLFDHCYRSRCRFLRGDRRWIQQESTFWRRSLWDRVGGLNTAMRLAGDFDLWFRFYQLERLYQLDMLVGAFRRHGAEQLSSKHRLEYEAEVDQIVAEFRASNTDHPSMLMKLLDGLLKPAARRHPQACETLLEKMGVADKVGLARRVRLEQPAEEFRVTPAC